MDRLEVKGDNEMMELQLTNMSEAIRECMYQTRKHANSIAGAVTEWSYSYESDKKEQAHRKVLDAFEDLRTSLSEMVNLHKRAEPLLLLACEIETEAMKVMDRIKPQPVETVAEGCEGTDNE